MTINYNNNPDRLFDIGMPIGGIILFPGAIYDDVDANGERILKEQFRIGGWMEAAGQLIEVEEYSELYSVIGTTYNINSEEEKPTLFRLPDLRGLFVRGTQNDPRKDESRKP